MEIARNYRHSNMNLVMLVPGLTFKEKWPDELKTMVVDVVTV